MDLCLIGFTFILMALAVSRNYLHYWVSPSSRRIPVNPVMDQSNSILHPESYVFYEMVAQQGEISDGNNNNSISINWTVIAAPNSILDVHTDQNIRYGHTPPPLLPTRRSNFKCWLKKVGNWVLKFAKKVFLLCLP